MNKCIDNEKLIAFAMNPLESENAEIAAHLLSCKSCREEYHLARETVLADRFIPTEEDAAEAEAATTKLLSQSKWSKLNDLAEIIKQKFSSAVGSLSAKMLFAPQNASPVFAASRSSRFITKEQAPILTFESTTASCYKEYWKMNLHFPATVSKSSLLTLKLYDANGKALTSGQLTFQGHTLNVTAGIAVLPLTDFIASARIPEISYKFPDGAISEGVIKFLPEIVRGGQ